jgi:hypothetical protein
VGASIERFSLGEFGADIVGEFVIGEGVDERALSGGQSEALHESVNVGGEPH